MSSCYEVAEERLDSEVVLGLKANVFNLTEKEIANFANMQEYTAKGFVCNCQAYIFIIEPDQLLERVDDVPPEVSRSPETRC